jgi:hypothetical protein
MVSPLPPPAPTPPVGNMASNGDRTAHLLNLLKFSGSSSQMNQSVGLSGMQQPSPRDSSSSVGMPQPSIPQRILAPAPSAADPTGLLAAMMKGTHEPEDPKEAPPVGQQFNASSPPGDTRAYLLDLLNRPKPSQNDQPLLTESSRSVNLTPQSGDGTGDGSRKAYQGLQRTLVESGNEGSMPHAPNVPYDYDGRAFEHQASSFSSYTLPSMSESSIAPQKMFNYANPFDDLAAASPQNRTPKSSSTAGQFAVNQSAGHSPSTQSFQILKKSHASPASSHVSLDQKRVGSGQMPPISPEMSRRHLGSNAATPQELGISRQSPLGESVVGMSPLDRPTETVADAVSEIASQANREAQEALARAEAEQAHTEIGKGLEDMSNARTAREFDDSARIAGGAIKKELEREENAGILEEMLPPHVAQSVREIVEETAQGVADSWESADPDEIIVIEEESSTPVKVFNFPMKPWISITLQDGATEPRPQFRDEAIMDIARLKKEFDQIDRNLYTASENYMVYGMSKAGGLRVIRQDDGRDAKIFADTKDRIFNVAISVTPPDHNGVPREAIIGTGISGTVYWVQIKNGEKDHLEDAHPEQYGFALPPIQSQEGDAPGGVLKTRARTSAMHPEYFAVGRGKSISIIWPSFIMQQNLLKPGHDRVVDTERLAKQCSLKINTGKAGKDFTFSQDDTVIVSLDKSGRVKFWDVRDLTAAKEGSDPRAPIPARTSLEIKEPLMTLTSTPEGEKAWPTSVLLLDKLRPYQKRCALRYMIVGMKQNHTLQLWDLALGKPVQEFNLPHSKESDAVCSVMYHPPTGMLVIGHPTRNSVYFAHLSAPKYNLKSVSQVEYIQRLVAQDASIPQPDSTAVISGVREYSLDNRGTLRSLDILCNPAMGQDSEEPTLFEIYAMHAKGVACLLIKQAELGWSKDNKVIMPVDAVDAGVVVIGKLKGPANPVENNHTNAAEDPSNAQVRLATRTQPKESLLQNASSHDDPQPRRGPELSTPSKLKSEVKDEDTPGHAPPAPANTDKPERKSRKKKPAAVTAQEPHSNGNSNSTRVAASTKHGDASKPVNTTSSSTTPINQESIESAVNTMETRLAGSLSGIVNSSLDILHGKFENSLRARDKDFDARQLKLLEMVSEVLNENTQQVLKALIHDEFNSAVIPAISKVAGKAVSDQLNNSLNHHISQTVQKEIQRALPSATQHALKSTDFVKSVSERVGAAVSTGVQQEVLNLISSRVTPTFTGVAVQAIQQAAGEIQRQYHAEFDRMNAQRLADSNRVEQLVSLVTRLSDTVSTMAAAQSQFQGEFLKLQQHAVHDRHGGSGHTGSDHQRTSSIKGQAQGPPTAGSMQSPSHQHSQSQASQNQANPWMFAANKGKQHMDYDPDLNEHIGAIDNLLKQGLVEEAMIRWVQTGREQDLYNRYLYKYSPAFLRELPPLVLLSVAVTLSTELDGPLLRERISWLEMVMHCFQSIVNSMVSSLTLSVPFSHHSNDISKSPSPWFFPLQFPLCIALTFFPLGLGLRSADCHAKDNELGHQSNRASLCTDQLD